MKNFRKNIIAMYGEYGRNWLAQLSGIIKRLSFEWGLSRLKPFDNLSFNYVLRGYQGTKQVVLKLGLDEKSLEREAQALQAFSGFGVVELLNQAPRALLLECAVPGRSLKTYFPEQDLSSINIFSDVTKRLQQASIPKEYSFPHIKDWLKKFDESWDISDSYLFQARRMRDDLLESCSEEVLLHGDLHHENIVQNGEAWVVIDPKGVIGDPYFEIAAFLRNPWPDVIQNKNALDIIIKRISLLTNHIDRVVKWSFVQAVLSWIWALEDNMCDDNYRELTKLFYSLIDKDM